MATALGKFRSESAGSELVRLVSTDPSYHVAASAVTAASLRDDVFSVKAIDAAMKRDAWRDMIRRSAINAARRVKKENYLDTALKYTTYSSYWETRNAAARTVGVLAERLEEDDTRRKTARERLEALLEDNVIQVRSTAAGALGTLGDSEAIAALEALLARKDYQGVMTAAESAKRSIRTGKATQDIQGEVIDRLDALEKENDQLRRDLEEIQEKVKSSDAKNP